MAVGWGDITILFMQLIWMTSAKYILLLAEMDIEKVNGTYK